MSEFARLFVAAMEHALRGLGTVAGREVTPFLEREAPSFLDKLMNALAIWMLSRIGGRLTNIELILVLLFAIILAMCLIGVCMIVNLLIGRRRARVFVSFQHEREATADALTSELARSGIAPVRLPFIEDPNHDLLLDQVKSAIRDCDVFLCLPGRRPSFVESEVMMAFGLEKPIVFVLIEADTPRLPNTAKKGYPIFALDRLQFEKSRILANFCSYLAADWRSTIRLYGAIFAFSFWPLSLILLLIYLVLILIVLTAADSSLLPEKIEAHGSPLLWVGAAVQDLHTLVFVVIFSVIFLIPYSVFMAMRFHIRSKIKRAISAEKFSASLFSKSFLSQTLDYSLAGDDLLNALYRDDVPAEHESEGCTPTALGSPAAV